MRKKLTILFFIFTVIFYARNVSAIETTSIMVYPTVQDIKVSPGINVRTQINFRNLGEQVLLGNIKTANYEVTDKTGSIRIIEDGNLKPKYAASSWITLDDDFIAIPKSGVVSVNILISPPSDLALCGHYALVYFQPLLDPKSNSLNVSTKIGSLLNFITDNKACNEKISITRFKAPIFLENGPIPVDFDLLNSGDIHISPKGFVSTSNIFKQFVDQQNIKEVKIFPERAKEYNMSIGKKWMIGRFKVAINISYGSTIPQTISKIVYIWVFPWKIMLFILLAIIVIYIFTVNLYRISKSRPSVKKSNIEILKEQIRKRE